MGKAGRAAAAADGAVIVRRLHASAVWNCASLPNAVVAIVAFAWVPDDLFIAEWPWLLPVALLVAKLLLAQALKEVAAASGVDRGAGGAEGVGRVKFRVRKYVNHTKSGSAAAAIGQLRAGSIR